MSKYSRDEIVPYVQVNNNTDRNPGVKQPQKVQQPHATKLIGWYYQLITGSRIMVLP